MKGKYRDLNTGITLTNFKLLGTIPVENETLNKVSNGLDNTFLSSFKIETDILKRPVAFKLFKLAISSSTLAVDLTYVMLLTMFQISLLLPLLVTK